MTKLTKPMIVGVLTVGLMVPMGAAAADDHTPAGPRGTCVKAAVEVRQEAQKDFREAIREARQKFRAATKDERMAKREALAEADTKAERKDARKEYRMATKDERAERKEAIAETRKERRQAQKTFKEAVQECRS